VIGRGEILYNRYCSRCHVFGRGALRDLRRMSPATHQIFYRIVLAGAYADQGMGRWDDVLSEADARAIHAFIVDQSWGALTAP
jgi:quinohemoprotein ethanol dehydrogenase